MFQASRTRSHRLGLPLLLSFVTVAGSAIYRGKQSPAGPSTLLLESKCAGIPQRARLQFVLGEQEVASRTATFALSIPALAGGSWTLSKDPRYENGARSGSFDVQGRSQVNIVLSAGWIAERAIGVHHAVFELGLSSGSSDAPTSALLTLSTIVESPRSLGINLEALEYYSSLFAFNNVFHQASRWIPQDKTGMTWNTGEELDLDDQGWVRSMGSDQAAAVLIARDLQGHYPAGRWTLEYEGKGKLEARLDGRMSKQRAGRATLEVKPTSAGIHLVLLETDASDPVRDIRLYAPGRSSESPLFDPRALELLEPFRALRFMDWQRTNDSEVQHWEQRSRADDAVQTNVTGVALEHMLALSNRLQSDAWFCMPHLATDDYVRSFAIAVRDGLDPQRRVYLEYSNEVWNSMFDQSRWAQKRGLELELAKDPFQAQLRFYSQRSVEVFSIWSEVFSDEPARLMRVLAGPAVNSWAGRQLLDWNDAWIHADAYSIAPYFGHSQGRPQTADAVAGLTPDELLNRLEQEMHKSLHAVVEHALLARERGLEMIAYEGGQHMVGQGPAVDNEALTKLFQDSNRHERMGALYRRSLDLWRQNGGGLYFAWNAVGRWSKWGSWGSMEYMDQTAGEAPKYEALRDFSRDSKTWWIGR
ncbi:MAG: hypothetical protein ACI841_002754 [Planctomycetota bacterium]|jgi:hypothetical protein